MVPDDLVHPRVGSHITLKVDVISFLDLVRTQVTPEGELHLRCIWRLGGGGGETVLEN